MQITTVAQFDCWLLFSKDTFFSNWEYYKQQNSRNAEEHKERERERKCVCVYIYISEGKGGKPRINGIPGQHRIELGSGY